MLGEPRGRGKRLLHVCVHKERTIESAQAVASTRALPGRWSPPPRIDGRVESFRAARRGRGARPSRRADGRAAAPASIAKGVPTKLRARPARSPWVSRGRSSVIGLSDVTVRFGAQLLYSGVSWQLHAGRHYGLAVYLDNMLL